MSHHIHYNHECPKCGAFYIPFDQMVPCPKCGEVESERFDFIPQAAESAQFNFLDLGRYMPDAWAISCFGDHILFIIFRVLEQHRLDTAGRTYSDITTDVLASLEWGDQLYLRDHVFAIACRVREYLDQGESKNDLNETALLGSDQIQGIDNPEGILNDRPSSGDASSETLQEDIAFRAYLLMEKRRKRGLSLDETSAWVQAERQIKKENSAQKQVQTFQFYTHHQLPNTVEIVGTVVNKDSTNKVCVSQSLPEGSIAVLTKHEQLHKGFLDGTLPPYEDLSYELQSSGDETTDIEYVSRLHSPYTSWPSDIPKPTTPILSRGSGLLGLAPTNPIPVNTVYHEYRYISELTCSHGTSLHAKRCGSFISDISKYPIDCFEISTAKHPTVQYIYLSPYCKHPAIFFEPEGYKQSPISLHFDKHYQISRAKIANYQKRLISILQAMPPKTATIETYRAEPNILMAKMLNSINEHSLRHDDYSSLSKEALDNFYKVLLWFPLLDIKWGLQAGDFDLVQKQYKYISSNIGKHPPIQIEEFKKQLNDLKRRHPPKLFNFGFLDIFKAK